jgi:HAD superfamily hydrolase (TIGR01549 family)
MTIDDSTKQPIDAVLFDIDGTLIDSVDFHAKAWVEAFEKFGHEVAYDRVRKQIGKGGDQLMPVFLSEADIGRIGKPLEEYRGQVLREKYLPLFKPFAQVRELLQRVIADGTKVGLASSAKAEELEQYKKIANIVDRVDADTSSADAEKSKPHPDIFEAALEKLGDLAPERVIVVGDTPYDAEAAAKAGIRTIGLRCGGWSEAELKQAGCVAVFAAPADLLARYEGSPLARR